MALPYSSNSKMAAHRAAILLLDLQRKAPQNQSKIQITIVLEAVLTTINILQFLTYENCLHH